MVTESGFGSRNARSVGKRGVSAPRGWAGENGGKAFVGRAQLTLTSAPIWRCGVVCEYR